MFNIRNFFKKGLGFLARKFGLEEGGERVNLVYRGPNSFNFAVLDMYQKSHVGRYEFACSYIKDHCGRGTVGDFACGTGYGTAMLAEVSAKAMGADISQRTVKAAKRRYANVSNLEFIESDVLELSAFGPFDSIVSFETVEHLPEEKIPELFGVFAKILKPKGTLIFSTPYMQQKTETAVKMGFHLTFDINEDKILLWLKQAGLELQEFYYQNYENHVPAAQLEKKDFIITIAKKING